MSYIVIYAYNVVEIFMYYNVVDAAYNVVEIFMYYNVVDAGVKMLLMPCVKCC